VALLAALLAFLLRREPGAADDRAPLLVYCAAGLRVPVEAVARAYEKELGIPVQLQYGGSQTLLANAEASRRGDVYLPADDSFLKLARDKGLAAEAIPVAEMKPVLAVRKGNPKGVRSIEDLRRPDVRVGQANPEATAVGKLVKEALAKGGAWEELKKKTTTFKPTVNDVANDLVLGTVDAGFVWDATVAQYPDLERVEAPALAGVSATMSAAVLASSGQPAKALRFARYLAAPDRGLPELRKAGFAPLEGDAWAEKPELLFYAGAMLRPAVEKTLVGFSEREDVRITRVYNGCGILVAQMKAGARPDVYFACDESFMKDVADLFPEPQAVSLNQLVILVHKGNPHGIKALKDLAKPGVKLGIGHEKQCALGVITQETLRQTKLNEAVMKNVVVQSPTGDLLVNQMRTGTLDAAVAYVSNAAGSADYLDAVAVNVPCALATQPIAVGKDSARKRLAGRLVDALRSVESRQRFEAEGFRWQARP
jgi:molybdenum ABC transporter molybdate-binding protein